MIDIGYTIPRTAQYIIIIIGALLILSGVIVALVHSISSRKAHKQKKPQGETKEVTEDKNRKRRSSKY